MLTAVGPKGTSLPKLAQLIMEARAAARLEGRGTPPSLCLPLLTRVLRGRRP